MSDKEYAANSSVIRFNIILSIAREIPAIPGVLQDSEMDELIDRIERLARKCRDAASGLMFSEDEIEKLKRIPLV